MDTATLAANLKRLRGARRMSQRALSDASGVSLPAIKNIESRRSTPRANTLMQLSQALDVRFEEFFRPSSTLKRVRFRSKKHIAGREQILSNVTRWLEDYSSLEELLGDRPQYALKSIKAPSLKKRDPVSLAARAREALDLAADEPIHDICGLLEHAGVKLNQYSFSSDSFFGLSVGPDDGGPAIVANTWSRISAERRIFSAAHELGHLIMHLGSFDPSDESEEKQEEKEADLFASHFLMPKEGFDREWQETAGLPFPDRVMKVKRIFRVSYKTVLFRLIEKGVVDQSIWRRFKVIYEQRYRRNLSFKEEPFSEGAEPLGMESIDFVGDRLSRLTRRAVEEEKISVSRAAEILGLSVDEMMGRLAEWESFD